MKLKPYHIALIMGFLFMAPIAYAQESSSPVMESMDSDKDKGQYFPSGDSQSARDSADYSRPIVQPKTDSRRSTEKSGGTYQDDDSVLSFNFLYYIIQKFKMSDIVDQ